MARHLTVEPVGEVAVVRIDRPPANALDPELLAESAALVANLRADGPAAIVITGQGGFFSAGVDLKLVPTMSEADQREMVDGINALFCGWYSFPRPVVCAITGHAIAGGLILALCGDYRVGATQGKLGLTEIRAGVPYPGCAIAAVRAELTPAAVRRLALLADLVDPETALALGVLDELVPLEEVEPRAVAVATELAALPAVPYAHTKQQLRGETVAVMEAVIAEGDPMQRSWLDPDSGEAAARILREGR